MTPSRIDVFGSEFLPGKDKNDSDVISRAMGHRFGGTVGNPINDSVVTWNDDFASSNTTETNTEA